MKEVIAVAIGVLIEARCQADRLLVTRRRGNAVLGGFWELPGGKIETGENAADCLVREFAEELGLTIRVGAALEAIEHRYDHGPVRLHPHVCTRATGEPRNLEVAEHRWVTAVELDELKFPPANDRLMNQLSIKLAHRSA